MIKSHNEKVSRDEVSTTSRYWVGQVIADFQLSIFDWRVSIEAIKNLKSEIGNHLTHPLPRGGTDSIAQGQWQSELNQSFLKHVGHTRTGEC